MDLYRTFSFSVESQILTIYEPENSRERSQENDLFYEDYLFSCIHSQPPFLEETFPFPIKIHTLCLNTAQGK